MYQPVVPDSRPPSGRTLEPSWRAGGKAIRPPGMVEPGPTLAVELAAMVMLRACVAVWPAASLTCTVKENVAAEVGTPPMLPLMLSRERPAGNWPEATDQV